MDGQQRMKECKCEIYRDNFQNFKRYGIPKAQLVIADVPYCYDEQTQCWTRRGWLNYNELTLDDVVLTLNPTTLEMAYSGIEDIIIRDNVGPMYSFQSFTMDFLVTENHRMFCHREISTKTFGGVPITRTNKTGIRLSQDVNISCYIPHSGYTWSAVLEKEYISIPECDINTNWNQHVEPEKHIRWENWLPFFGLWLADGCTCNSKAKNGRQLYTVSIKQAGDSRKKVHEILGMLPFKYKEYKEKKRNESNFNIFSKQLWLYLRQFGKSQEKYIPREILDLPTEYLKIFWDAYTFGDSHKNGFGIKISTVSRRLIEGLQEIALKLGVICQVRQYAFPKWSNPLYHFQFNKNSKHSRFSSKKRLENYHGKVWCIRCKQNSIFLVRRNGIVNFCGNCLGTNAYGSSPQWYVGGDNANGESEKAAKPFFNTDMNFNLVEYMHFCNRLLIKEPKERNRAPAMIVFCAFEQAHELTEVAAKYGFKHGFPIFFIKDYSAQALKANMKIVGATEMAMVFYRDKLPKFRNGGRMVFNWFRWTRDGKEIPRIHPTQKSVGVLKTLISIFTDPGDVVIDPCAGSGTTLRAAYELHRSAYGFEIDRKFYNLAKTKMLANITQEFDFGADEGSVEFSGEEEFAK